MPPCVARTLSRLVLTVFLLLASSWAEVTESKAATVVCNRPGQESCSAGELASLQSDHVLLQKKPTLVETGVDHNSAAAVNASLPSFSSLPSKLAGRGAACTPSAILRRRRNGACTCRRRSSGANEDAGTAWQCEGVRMVPATPSWHAPPGYRPSAGTTPPRPGPPSSAWRTPPGAKRVCSACLCVFDIDRTLTGKQGHVGRCPRNKELHMYDAGYGGGNATLSALATEGIATTFCNKCYLGITSAGHGSGEHSKWNRYLLKHVMRGETHDAFTAAHPESQRWSHISAVHSPYVIGQPNKVKQDAVERIRRWFGAPSRDVCIRPDSVFFFGDRTENIRPFQSMHFNSREISCASRDDSHHRGIGYCGAAPEEIKREAGNVLCTSSSD